jgi:folate-binding Fe-S cluster repair protein YgfZ
MFAHDQYDALQTSAGLLDRTARGRLELTGADRRSYLHGLLTNDIAALGPGAGAYAALLTPQGRMVSDMRVSELGETVLIDLPRATADTVRQRLADFIFSEDVEVRDAASSLAHFGLYGPLAADVLATVVSRAGPNPELSDRQRVLAGMSVNTNTSWEFDDATITLVRSDDYGVPGFEVFVEARRGSRARSAAQASWR